MPYGRVTCRGARFVPVINILPHPPTAFCSLLSTLCSLLSALYSLLSAMYCTSIGDARIDLDSLIDSEAENQSHLLVDDKRYKVRSHTCYPLIRSPRKTVTKSYHVSHTLVAHY